MIATQSDPVQITGPFTGARRPDPNPASRPFSGQTVAPCSNRGADGCWRRAALRQQQIDAGEMPDFPAETARDPRGALDGAPNPGRPAATGASKSPGPTDRKMVINALNSGANVFMADFEDSNSPTWQNVHRRAGQSARCGQRHDHVHQPRRKALRTVRAAGRADGASARLAPGGEALSGRRAARFRHRCSISACSSFTTPAR